MAEQENTMNLTEMLEAHRRERERLVWAMERCGWVQAKAARLLKISPRQMGYALQKHGIEVRNGRVRVDRSVEAIYEGTVRALHTSRQRNRILHVVELEHD